MLKKKNFNHELNQRVYTPQNITTRLNINKLAGKLKLETAADQKKKEELFCEEKIAIK